MHAKPALTRRSITVAGILVASAAPGCFALFSLDDYGPPDEATDAGPSFDAARDADGAAADAKLSGRTIFVTRERFTGDLGGVDGGDGKCQAAAADGGLDGSFKVWLDDNRMGALGHLALDAGPLRLTNGALVASNTLDLATGGPQSAIVRDQRGSVIGGGGCTDGGTVAWTGTFPDGGSAASNDCQRWRVSGSNQTAVVGLVGGPGGTWATACVRSCQTPAALYCIQQ